MLYCNADKLGLYPDAMTQLTIAGGRLDRLAMGLSGLCAVHCVATAVALSLLASAGGFLGQPIIHEVGLSLAMILAAFALAAGSSSTVS